MAQSAWKLLRSNSDRNHWINWNDPELYDAWVQWLRQATNVQGQAQFMGLKGQDAIQRLSDIFNGICQAYRSVDCSPASDPSFREVMRSTCGLYAHPPDSMFSGYYGAVAYRGAMIEPAFIAYSKATGYSGNSLIFYRMPFFVSPNATVVSGCLHPSLSGPDGGAACRVDDFLLPDGRRGGSVQGDLVYSYAFRQKDVPHPVIYPTLQDWFVVAKTIVNRCFSRTASDVVFHTYGATPLINASRSYNIGGNVADYDEAGVQRNQPVNPRLSKADSANVSPDKLSPPFVVQTPPGFQRKAPPQTPASVAKQLVRARSIPQTQRTMVPTTSTTAVSILPTRSMVVTSKTTPAPKPAGEISDESIWNRIPDSAKAAGVGFLIGAAGVWIYQKTKD